MSATIRATCPTCDDIKITSDVVTITGHSYQFTCPTCDLHIMRYAEAGTIRLLTTVGCKAVRPLLDVDAFDLARNLDATDNVWAELGVGA